MTCWDDCYLCHWHMEGPWKKMPGGGSGQEIWCGAGRPEFASGVTCPTRVPFYEQEFNLTDHPNIVVSPSSYVGIDRSEVQLSDAATDWIAANQPNTKVEMAYEDCLVLRFNSGEDAVLFRMFLL